MWKSLCLVALFFLPVVVSAERITSFTADYVVDADGSVAVTEEIVYDFGTESRHGMFRLLETDHPDAASVWYKRRQVDISNISVRRNGQSEPFMVSGQGTQEIKIGDPDTTITGSHTYTISYELAGALRHFSDDTSELYWNVTGSNWAIPIEKGVVTVSGVSFTEAQCYTTAGTCVMERATPTTYAAMVEAIAPGGELTIGIGMAAGSVIVRDNEAVRTDLVALFLIIPMIVFTIMAAWRYEYFYYRKRPIIAEYEPYEKVEPMFAGTLIDDRLDARDITAGLVYLAQQGFIHIKRTEKTVAWLFNVTDYELTLKRPLGEVSSQFLVSIAKLIFTDNPPVGGVTALSSIKKDQTKKRANSLAIEQLRTGLAADLVERGFFEQQKFHQGWWSVAVLFAVVVFFPTFLQNLIGLPLYLVLVALVICLFIYNLVTHRRRTIKGYEAMFHLKGFKEFLSVTDKERFDFHNAPERSPEQFMEFLPYAIAFGVEEKWAEVFADMEISAPSWYDGQGTTFAAAAFTSDIGAFASTVTASTRASSGSGSAGGGGGGGGGGSW